MALKRNIAKKSTSSARSKSASKKPARATSSKSTASRTSSSKRVASSRAAAPKAAAVKPQAKKIRKATKPKNDRTLGYTQGEFFENLKGFCGLEKRTQAKEFWDDLSMFVIESLRKGYRVPLVGLGKMYVRKTKARTGRNPATGATIQIPARKRVRFTPAKALKDAVLG